MTISNLSCHIIGLNPYSKKEFINSINNKIFNVVDLDLVNQQILQHPDLDKMYQQFEKLKATKNDKYKELDKRMSDFWEKNFLESVQLKIKDKKMNILLGQNNHYKSIKKRINIDCTNKFIIKGEMNDDIKSLIKYNLENHKDDIINGNFPLEYLNFDYLLKKKEAIDSTYKKLGYIEKSMDQIKNMMKLIETTENKNEMWISLKEPYNVGSLIHPQQNDKLIGYLDPNMSLLGSFIFNKEELVTNYNGSEITIKEITPKSTKKLKSRRYLYLVESKTFMPHENGSNLKFFSQLPVKILAKEKVDNVYKYLNNDNNYEDKNNKNFDL
jgi:hypothetical protein